LAAQEEQVALAEQVELVLEEVQIGLLTLEEVQLTVQIAALSSSLQEVLLLGTGRFTPLKVM
jgi:hypothetical protein